jgi:MFS family permease
VGHDRGAAALQGVGTAILLPATVAVLRVGYPRERQDDALGVWGAVGGLSFAVGPLIGGALTDTVGWRWLWWSTAVVAGAVALAAVPVLSSLPTPQRRPRQDVGGIVLLAVSLFALILAIQQAPRWGWASAPTIGALAASAIGLVLLVRLENRHDEPLLHLRLLRSPRLVAANLVAFVNILVLIGILFFFNLYTQAGLALDYSALTASLALLPYAAAAFGGSLLAGRWCDRAGFTVPVTCGLLLMGVGGLLLGLLGTRSGYAALWWPSTILGLGVGVTSVAPFAVGLSAVGTDRAGEVSGIINVVRYLAAALVVSAGTVLFTAVGARHVNAALAAADLPPAELGHLDAVLTGAPERIAAVARELGLSTAQVSTYEAGAAAGVAGGFAAVMLGLGAISLAATGAWLALARRTGAAGSGGAAVGDR